MKIRNEIVPDVYEISKLFHENKLTLKDGTRRLTDGFDLNPNSARDYMYAFKYLMEGQRFTRTLNAFSMEYFIDNIFKDFGQEGLSKALGSLKQHIHYFENVQNTKMIKLRDIYDRYVILISDEIDPDEGEQSEIIRDIKITKKSKKDILNELKNLKESDPQIVIINGKTFKRDNKTIAQIKILRDFSCQICNAVIIKRDGTKYVEAAHIIPKHEKGRETLNNIILLCPNHHKEFDLGDTKILSHTETELHFSVNGKKYHILFEA